MIRGSNSLRIIRRQNLVLDPKLIRENPEIVKHATLAKRVASPELVDAWRLAARHLAPDREDELCATLVAVEARSWQRVKTDQQSTDGREVRRRRDYRTGGAKGATIVL